MLKNKYEKYDDDTSDKWWYEKWKENIFWHYDK